MARPPPPPFSAAPPPSEAVQPEPAVAATKTNKRSYRTSIKFQRFDPYRPFNKDEMKVLDSLIDISKDKVLKKRVVGKDRSVKPAYDDDDDDDDEIFDANGLFNPKLPGSAAPVDLKEDPSEFRTLTRCATLAIDDYNSYNKTIYRFVNIEMATWQLVNGLLYHITFRARNAEKEYRTFQSTVFSDDRRIQVMNIRMKGSSTCYLGNLSELN